MPYKEGVGGSNPSAPTTAGQNEVAFKSALHRREVQEAQVSGHVRV